MKGLYVINSLEGGGAEKVFSLLVSLINDDPVGGVIEVVLLDVKNESYLLPRNIRVHRIGRENFLLSFFEYIRLIRSIKPDYVTSFLTRSNNFNVLGKLLFGYISIISERSNTTGRLKGRFKTFKRGVVKYLYKRADSIIAVSQGVKSCLVGEFSIDSDKISLLNNAVDIERISVLSKEHIEPKSSNYIVAMGRLVKTKAFDCLINAYAKAEIKSDLYILGQGPEKDRLVRLAKSLNVGDKVFFKGFQSNPYPYIKKSEFFVLSSELEGFPNALVEALGLGKAVLSTNCVDGPSEILNLKGNIEFTEVVEAEFGMLVNVRDEVALSQGLKKLEADRGLRESYQNASLACATRYSTDRFYMNYKRIINHAFHTRCN